MKEDSHVLKKLPIKCKVITNDKGVKPQRLCDGIREPQILCEKERGRIRRANFEKYIALTSIFQLM